MPTTTGIVNCVLVQTSLGLFELDDGAGTEQFVIWPNGAPSRVEAMWSDVLSDAAANNREVEVSHSDGSAQIASVRINRTP